MTFVGLIARNIISRPLRAVLTASAVAIGVMAVVALTALATAGDDRLPSIMEGNRYTPAMIGVVSSVWVFSLVALAVIWVNAVMTYSSAIQMNATIATSASA